MRIPEFLKRWLSPKEPAETRVELSDDLESRPAYSGMGAFSSGVIRVARGNAQTPEPLPRRAVPLEEDIPPDERPTRPTKASTYAQAREEAEARAQAEADARAEVVARAQASLFEDSVEPVAAPVDWDALYRFATSRNDVLSNEVLRYFDACGIMPIVGVNDPALRMKLAHPGHYGWSDRVNCVETRSGRSLSGMRMWRLEAPPGSHAGVGQNVILTDNGEVFVETAGPWGTTWIHRAENGAVTSREHRIAPVRPPQMRPRPATRRARDRREEKGARLAM